MTNILRGSIYPVLLGIVLVIVPAFVVVIATGFQNAMATPQLQPLVPMDGDADVDVAEAEEGGNATMTTGIMNQNSTAAEFLGIQSVPSGSLTG